MKTDQLFVVTLYARPKAGSKDAKKYCGAYVNCWVNYALSRGAEVVARDYVLRNGWKIRGKATVKTVTRKHYKNDKRLTGYFDEAVKTGISTVFHTHPQREQKKKK